MCQVIEIDCNGLLSKEFDVLHTDLLVLDALLNGLGIYFERFTELEDTVLLTRLIDLHQNYLLKRQKRFVFTLSDLLEVFLTSFFFHNLDGHEC